MNGILGSPPFQYNIDIFSITPWKNNYKRATITRELGLHQFGLPRKQWILITWKTTPPHQTLLSDYVMNNKNTDIKVTKQQDSLRLLSKQNTTYLHITFYSYLYIGHFHRISSEKLRNIFCMLGTLWVLGCSSSLRLCLGVKWH